MTKEEKSKIVVWNSGGYIYVAMYECPDGLFYMVNEDDGMAISRTPDFYEDDIVSNLWSETEMDDHQLDIYKGLKETLDETLSKLYG